MKQFDLVNFLNKFYGITNVSLNTKLLAHQDIKKIFPFIRTCPIWNVFMDDVYRGELIEVYDKNNVIMYYYNPHLDVCYSDILTNNDDENIEINLFNLDNLSKDELLKLRRKARIIGLQNESKYLTKLIRKKKKQEPKVYRKEKEKLKIKESYYD